MAASGDSLSVDTLFRVDGLVAVITGGGTGLGLMIAKALDANGAAAVYIMGRRQDVLEKAAKEGKNGKIIPHVCDVTDKEQLAAAAERVQREHGHLNVLIANSGITGPGKRELLPKDHAPSVAEYSAAMLKPSLAEFSAVAQLNVTALFYTAMTFLPLLDAGNRRADRHPKSQIIATSSISGFARKMAAGYAYSASKAAVNHLVKILASEMIPYDIRVNAIAPGIYPSQLTADGPVMQFPNPTQYGSIPRDLSPLTRIGDEQDMAGNALFLISRAGSHTNGTILVTDGGHLGQVPGSY